MVLKWGKSIFCLTFLSTGINPGVGLTPYILANAAGILHDPIISDPSDIGTNSAAIAAAEPPLDPPAELFVSYTFAVGPNNLLLVCAPTANSGILVLPMIIAQ